MNALAEAAERVGQCFLSEAQQHRTAQTRLVQVETILEKQLSEGWTALPTSMVPPGAPQEFRGKVLECYKKASEAGCAARKCSDRLLEALQLVVRAAEKEQQRVRELVELSEERGRVMNSNPSSPKLSVGSPLGFLRSTIQQQGSDRPGWSAFEQLDQTISRAQQLMEPLSDADSELAVMRVRQQLLQMETCRMQLAVLSQVHHAKDKKTNGRASSHRDRMTPTRDGARKIWEQRW